MLLDGKIEKGLHSVKWYNLSFEDSLYFHQLPGLVSLARTFPPETAIILNHSGVPLGIGPYAGKRGGGTSEWEKGIGHSFHLSQCSVKLRGMGMPKVGFGWQEMPKPPDSGTL